MKKKKTKYQTGLYDFSITLYKCDMYYNLGGDYTVLLYTLPSGEFAVRIVGRAASKLAMPVTGIQLLALSATRRRTEDF